MTTLFRHFNLQEMPHVAEYDVLPLIKNRRIVTFSGPLGAGKTTLIKKLVALLGVSEVVTSPTFTYVNEYFAADGALIYHFDLYRIAHIDSFYESGFDEYLSNEEARCFIEWPEVIMPILCEEAFFRNVCNVTLAHSVEDPQVRKIRIDLL